jgi:hypothetical protein
VRRSLCVVVFEVSYRTDEREKVENKKKYHSLTRMAELHVMVVAVFSKNKMFPLIERGVAAVAVIRDTLAYGINDGLSCQFGRATYRIFTGAVVLKEQKIVSNPILLDFARGHL